MSVSFDTVLLIVGGRLPLDGCQVKLVLLSI
jgi:hypothetical protein